MGARHARMLTEQAEPGLVGGPNVWCPVSAYDHERGGSDAAGGRAFLVVRLHRAEGALRTLFIDHPGTELRVWLWQTWQREIERDPGVGHRLLDVARGLSRPGAAAGPLRGSDGLGQRIQHAGRCPPGLGNGDGRFLYPPESAADGRPAAPVLDGRWLRSAWRCCATAWRTTSTSRSCSDC